MMQASRSARPALVVVVLLLLLPGATLAGSDRWTSNGPYGGLIRNFLFDPANTSTVYTGCGWNGVFKSTDGGATWTRASEGIDADGFVAVYSLAMAPSTPETILAATGTGLFRTDDGAQSWVRLGPDLIGSTKAVAVDPSSPTTIYVAQDDDGIVKSTDGGRTWTAAGGGLGNGEVEQLVIDPQAPQTLYALVDDGIERPFKTTDGAASWTQIDSGLPEVGLSELVLDPSDHATLYLSAYDANYGVFKSGNAGHGWVHLGAPASWISSLAVDPRDPQVLYAGAILDGLYRSEDGGATWTRLDSDANGFINDDVKSVALDPSDSSRIYVGMWRAGLFRSTDSGASWSLSNHGLTGLGTSSLAIDPVDPSILYAATEFAVWKSVNGGDTWEPRPNGPEYLEDLAIGQVAVDPQTPSTVYAGANGGVWKSVDAGTTWVELMSLYQVESLAIDPEAPQTVYAGTLESLYKTTDGGRNWFHADSGLTGEFVQDIEIDPLAPTTLYTVVGWEGGIFKSTDGASSWTRLDLVYEFPSTLEIHPEEPLTLYANSFIFVEGGGYPSLATSLDGGKSWTEEYPGGWIFRLEVDPRDPEWLYAAFGSTIYGLFRSRDGGNTWESFNEGLVYDGIGAVVFDPQEPRRFYIATGSGVFEMLEGGLFEDGFESGDTSAWSSTEP